MPLVTSTEMFQKAYEGGYAIGAFNVNNMEIIQGITEAAKEVHAPLILQVSAGARKYANHTYLMKLVEAAEIETGLPICLHLDHGDSFELCKSCIDGGFTSVMIDLCLVQGLIPWQSPLAPAMALISSNPAKNRSCVLIFWKKSESVCRDSPLCFTALLL